MPSDGINLGNRLMNYFLLMSSPNVINSKKLREHLTNILDESLI